MGSNNLIISTKHSKVPATWDENFDFGIKEITK